MMKVSPVQFLRQVRNEIKKVTWPTRKETAVSTLMVFIMASLAGVFFFFLDQILSWGIQIILGIGG